jgi:ABC-type multidrug transport system ATPase subunit
VEQGEILGFLGPSGAGKSTTRKILIGLLRRYQGGVTLRVGLIAALARRFQQAAYR